MKTLILISGIILLFSCSTAHAQGWVQTMDFPSDARDDGTSFTIGSITYCGTGLNSTWTPMNDFYAFDMNTDSWSPISGLPANEARQYSNGFSNGNQGYVFGGLNSTGYLSDLWRYDPLTDSWMELSPMPSIGRSGASCFVIGDTAYIVGGQTQLNPVIDEVWAYSMSSDSWIQKTSLPTALWRASAISHLGKGYLLFGTDDMGNYRNDLYEYSPSTGLWTPLTSFPGVGRTYTGVSILNNEIVIVAGRDSIGNSYNDMWKYSTSTDSWNLSVNLPADQRRGGLCFSSGSSLYYSTGINLDNTRLVETWKYDLFLATNDFELNQASISPNPCSDFLIIHGTSYEPVNYEIISMDGSVVKSGKADLNSKIGINGIHSGQYVIRIQSTLNTSTKKILIL